MAKEEARDRAAWLAALIRDWVAAAPANTLGEAAREPAWDDPLVGDPARGGRRNGLSGEGSDKKARSQDRAFFRCLPGPRQISASQRRQRVDSLRACCLS